jgi:hypothetical protein
MEGWRQGRLGSRAETHREKEKDKNILTGKKGKTYLTLTGLLMEGFGAIAGVSEGSRAACGLAISVDSVIITLDVSPFFSGGFEILRTPNAL